MFLLAQLHPSRTESESLCDTRISNSHANRFSSFSQFSPSSSQRYSTQDHPVYPLPQPSHSSSVPSTVHTCGKVVVKEEEGGARRKDEAVALKMGLGLAMGDEGNLRMSARMVIESCEGVVC